MLRSALVITFVFASGCDLLDMNKSSRTCRAISIPAITVEVVSADPDQPLDGEARVEAHYLHDGERLIYHRTIRDLTQDNTTTPINDLTGVYDRVTVEKEGYETWTKEDVVVESDGCHPETVHLTARLEKAE